jgi:peptidyl-prolyl cis-trans isomerase C
MLNKFIFRDFIFTIGILFLIITVAMAEEKDVLAKIGSKVITKGEFEQLLKKRGEGLSKDRQMEIGLLNNIVQTMALGDAARKKGMDKRKDIQAIIDLTVDSVLANELIKEEVIDKINITEEKAKKYYEAHQDQFKIPEKARFSHILIRVEKSATDETRKKARERSEEILIKIKSGEDFAKLAMEYSEDPGSKTKGGDLGFFEKGRMPKDFDETAFKLNPGAISGIVETAYGFHIIKMEEKKKEALEPFETIKDKVMTKAKDEMRNEKIRAYLAQVMKEADVKIFPEVLGKKE